LNRSILFVIASNDHNRPSLDPRNTCGQLLILPQVYLDLMFGDQPDDTPDTELASNLILEDCLKG